MKLLSIVAVSCVLCLTITGQTRIASELLLNCQKPSVYLQFDHLDGSEEKGRLPRLVENYCLVSSGSWIAGGGSVLFSLPLCYFDQLYVLSVAFEYEWENSRDIEHRVFFSREDILLSAK